jgi:hypothetical protein
MCAFGKSVRTGTYQLLESNENNSPIGDRRIRVIQFSSVFVPENYRVG